MAKRKPRQQYAALPIRIDGDAVMVMLVTSRETRRWIIPKGWSEKNLAPHELAAKEAVEEAGLVGAIEQVPLGSYDYVKFLRGKRRTRKLACTATVFRLHVLRQLDDWKEKGERECRWFTLVEAVDLVSDPGLAAILQGLIREERPTATTSR